MLFRSGLHGVTKINPTVTQLLISNRFRPGLAGVVGHLTQTGLCVIDTADVPFGEIVRRAAKATVSAGKNAYYDVVARDALIDRIGAERGAEIDLSCYFNDRRTRSRQPPAELPTTADVEAAVGADAARFVCHVERRTRRLFCHVNDVPDTMDVLIRADTHHISPADVRACLRTMADTIVTSALRPSARA